MFPLFLLAVAFGIMFVVLLFYAWRQVDRRVKLAYGDEPIEELTQQLEQALEQQQRLTSRIEHLEAIIASEPWDARSREETPLAAPDEASDAAREERAARPGQRQQSR